METRAPFILVGLFTVLGAAALLGFALWMSGAGTDRDVNRYEVLFREAVYGLSVGSPVLYSGIRVGEVEQLALDLQDPRLVRVQIQVAASTPVKTDTRASQQLLNVTGAAGIELGAGLPDSPVLTAANGLPVIEATPSSLSQLRVTSEELLLSATTLLERANGLLSDQNASRAAHILDNIDVVTSTLAAEQDTLRAGIESLVQSSQSLETLLTQASGQLLRMEDAIMDNVATTLGELQSASAQLNTLFEDSRPAVVAGMQGFAELEPAMRDLRSVLSNIDSITRQITDNPSGYLLGTESIREYQP